MLYWTHIHLQEVRSLRRLFLLFFLISCLILPLTGKAGADMQPLAPCYGTVLIQNNNGLYLSGSDAFVCAASAPQTWTISAYNDRFYIKDGSDFLALEYYGGVISMVNDTGYTEQQWRILKCADGSYRIQHADSDDHYLCADAWGQLSIVPASQADNGCVWWFRDPSLTWGHPYVEILTSRRIVSLRVDPEVFDVISHAELQLWVSRLERAYDAYTDLTGFAPFPQIEVRGYTNCGDWGYVYAGKPVIHIDRLCLLEDLGKMAQRTNDWNFGVLHEMSHLFDLPHWEFHDETTANFKIAYVLLMNAGGAAPAEFPASTLFTHATLRDGWKELHGTLLDSHTQPIISLCARLWEVTDRIGWQAVRYAFRSFPDQPDATALEKFETFLGLLSDYSGIDVASLFTDAEWAVIRNELSSY